jgi:hypothetical protein
MNEGNVDGFEAGGKSSPFFDNLDSSREGLSPASRDQMASACTEFNAVPGEFSFCFSQYVLYCSDVPNGPEGGLKGGRKNGGRPRCRAGRGSTGKAAAGVNAGGGEAKAKDFLPRGVSITR